MRVTDLRWLLGAAVALGVLLAACSGPQTAAPEAPENTVVSIDGMEAQIVTSKLDLQALSFFHPPTTTYCDAGDNVAYAQIVVPMLAVQDRHLVSYVDVFFMPRDWNHKLVLYAHGYLDPLDPDWLQSFLGQAEGTAPGSEQLAATRDRVLCQHYAVGLSSYSSPGYAVKEGIIDTHLLNAVFRFLFWRAPQKTYVIGSSLGGLITVALAEQFPNRYDGAMPTCGPIGGSLAEFGYVGNVRLLFETAFGNDVLNGDLTDWQPPAADWVGDVTTAVQDPTNAAAALALGDTAVTYPAPAALGGSITLPLVQTLQTYAPWLETLGYDADLGTQTNAAIGLNALLHALRYHVVGAQDVMSRGDGSPFSTENLDYGPLVEDGPYVAPPETYVADTDAVTYYTRYYQPSGILGVPTLSMHNYVDPDVPTAHEYVYQALVASALGPAAAQMLRSYLVMGYTPDDLLQMLGVTELPKIEDRGPLPYGHCNFRPADMVAGLDALDHRATYGAWPTIANGDFRPLPAPPAIP